MWLTKYLYLSIPLAFVVCSRVNFTLYKYVCPRERVGARNQTPALAYTLDGGAQARLWGGNCVPERCANDVVCQGLHVLPVGTALYTGNNSLKMFWNWILVASTPFPAVIKAQTWRNFRPYHVSSNFRTDKYTQYFTYSVLKWKPFTCICQLFVYSEV